MEMIYYDFFRKQLHIGDYVIFRKTGTNGFTDTLCIGVIYSFAFNTAHIKITNIVDGYDFWIGGKASVMCKNTIKLTDKQCDKVESGEL